MNTTHPPPLQAILFDMDGTLVDSAAPIRRSWTAWAARHQLDAAHVLDACQGRRAMDTIAHLVPHKDVQAEGDWMLAREISDTDGVVPIAGSGALLRALGARQWAVVTSAFRPLAEARIRAAGLPLPEVMITGDVVRHGKPDPEGFLLAAQRLGVPPEACLVVEDTPPGLMAGRRAKMQLLGLSTTYPAHDLPCERVIRDYTGVRITTTPTLSLAFF